LHVGVGCVDVVAHEVSIVARSQLVDPDHYVAHAKILDDRAHVLVVRLPPVVVQDAIARLEDVEELPVKRVGDGLVAVADVMIKGDVDAVHLIGGVEHVVNHRGILECLPHREREVMPQP
jgi:hypothetical protein